MIGSPLTDAKGESTMSFPSFGGYGDPGRSEFAAHWDHQEQWLEKHDWYWDFAILNWKHLSPSQVRGLDGVELVAPSGSSFEVYPKLQQAWPAVKAREANALWDAQSGRWVVSAEAGPLPRAYKDLIG